MATPFKIQLEPQNSGLLGMKLGQSEASKATDLLQKDLEVTRTEATLCINYQVKD
jgi:hypothetical protein